MTRSIRLFPLVSALCVFGGAAQAQPQPRSAERCLTLTHIWTSVNDEDPFDFRVTDMNDKGEVVGYGAGPHASQGAFLWRKGQFIDLGALIGHAETFAYGINDHGDVVGSWSDGGQQSQAFLLRHGRVIDIQGVPDASSTQASHVNNKRQIVVGRAELPYENFLWKRGSAALLEPIEPGGQTLPYNMNERGVVAGLSGSADGSAFRPVLWQDGTVMDLGLPEGARDAVAWDVNKRGQVAVTGSMPDGSGRPFIWQEGEMSELPLISDIPIETVFSALATGINDKGVVVGAIGTSNGAIPTVWRDARASDLNAMICSDDALRPYVQLDVQQLLIDDLVVINNRGQIVTAGFDLRIAPWRGVYLLTPKR